MLELRLGLSSAPATAGDACTDSQDYYGDSIHADTATATSDIRSTVHNAGFYNLTITTFLARTCVDRIK